MFTKDFLNLITTATLPGATLLVRSLENQGVKHIFGIPGAKIDRVFDTLVDEGPTLVVCRHEQNAAFMAQAVGRLTGHPGVCLVTSGPGASNLVTGLATSNTEGDPVVAFAGAVPRADSLKETHQSMQTMALFKPVTKYSVEIEHPDAIPEVVANSFRAAMSPRKGAAFVSLPMDILSATSSVKPALFQLLPTLGPAPELEISKTAAKLMAAKLPVLLLGMGASEPRAAKAINHLLQKVNFPVVSTLQGAGVVSRDLLRCFVGRIGLFRNQPGDQLLSQTDVVLTIGYDPVEYDPHYWNGSGKRSIIHLDESAALIDNHYQPEIELYGDIAATLDDLAYWLKPRSLVNAAASLHKAFMEMHRSPKTKQNQPIHPLHFIEALRKRIGDDVTVACDIGSHYIWMSRHFLSYEPRRLLFSNGQQTLGVALPWAIAAGLVHPHEKVISISGDGGFLFSSMELETAVRLKSNLVHFVWRDGEYNMVAFQEQMKYGRTSGIKIGEPDLVKYAESFGAVGLRVNSVEDLDRVLQLALNERGPVVVDIPIDYSDNILLGSAMHPGQFH